MKQLLNLILTNQNKERPKSLVNEAGQILIYDIIGEWGFSASDFANLLKDIKPDQPLHIRINSPGGDVFDGRAIATLIRNHQAETIAYIDGLAASAATTIVMPADKIVMAQGAMMMIHNSATMVWGNKNDMLETAALLEKIDIQIARDYAERMNISVDDALALMSAETWYSDEEAVSAGLADAQQDKKANNHIWDVSCYSNAPEIEKTIENKEIKAQRDKLFARLKLFESRCGGSRSTI